MRLHNFDEDNHNHNFDNNNHNFDNHNHNFDDDRHNFDAYHHNFDDHPNFDDDRHNNIISSPWVDWIDCREAHWRQRRCQNISDENTLHSTSSSVSSDK